MRFALMPVTVFALAGCAASTERDKEPFEPRELMLVNPELTGDTAALRRPDPTGRLAQGITLGEAEEIAFQANPTVLAMADAVNASRARIREAEVFTNPTFAVGKGELSFRSGPASSVVPSDVSTSRISGIDLRASTTYFSLSKDLDVSGKRLARVDAALETAHETEAQFASAALFLRAQVRTAYAAVLVAERNIELVKEGRDMAKRNLAVITGRAEGGNALKADALRAQADADRSEMDVKQAERDVTRLRRALATLLGAPDATVGALRDELPLPVPPSSDDEAKLVAAALERNADVIAARRAVRAAQANVRLQERSMVPDLTLQLQYNRYILDRIDTFGVQLGFPLPFFDQNRGQIAEATALLHQAEHQLDATEKGAIQAVRDDLLAIRLKKSRVAQFETSILPKYRDSVALMEKAYEAGKVLYVDVTTSRTAFNQARSDYVNELLAYETALADLERLIGGNR